MPCKLFIGALFCALCTLASSGWTADDPANRDSILDWNSIALAVSVEDHSGTFGAPQQGGPTRTARALAIAHAAMFDALNSIEPTAAPYLTQVNGVGGSLDAAVATAARLTLRRLYSKQASEIDRQYGLYLTAIPAGSAKGLGISVGTRVAQSILAARRNDGSSAIVNYTPTGQPGDHDVDPINPFQGFLTPGWGDVTQLALSDEFDFQTSPPPILESDEYTRAYRDVMLYGGDGVTTPTIRSNRQTEIGLYWAYDGPKRIGVPPRLYNQIAQVIARRMGNDEVENGRLFALINLAMGDAGIVCWETKYVFRFWRPILGIRNGNVDGNDATVGNPSWSPLGAPASNKSGNNFTPSFPSYSSGHATFGAATFGILSRFYGRDDIAFTFVSDELNGVTTDSQGNIRPLRPRRFTSLHAATLENARSRIYLGIHWQFDADEGVVCGDAIAEDIFRYTLLPNAN